VRWTYSTKECIASFIRRLVVVGAVVILVATVSGCVVRPLWWDGHDRRDHERSGVHYERQQRDEGRREEWRQGR
jgi:hypothetical protein